MCFIHLMLKSILRFFFMVPLIYLVYSSNHLLFAKSQCFSLWHTFWSFFTYALDHLLFMGNSGKSTNFHWPWPPWPPWPHPELSRRCRDICHAPPPEPSRGSAGRAPKRRPRWPATLWSEKRPTHSGRKVENLWKGMFYGMFYDWSVFKIFYVY